MQPNQVPNQSPNPGVDGVRPPSYPGNPPSPAASVTNDNLYQPPTSTAGQYNPYIPPPPPPPKKRKLRESWRSIAGTIFLLILAPLIALSITAFAFQSYQVDGASMEDTLSDKDRLIVNKIPRTLARLTGNKYTPDRGQIIIFSKDVQGEIGAQKQLIKRVVGLPGETVIVTDGAVVVSNSVQPDGFNPDRTTGYKIEATKTPGEARFTLSNDEIFVLGDNRTNSEDSRYFGPVKLEQIVGELAVRIMPLSEVQKF